MRSLKSRAGLSLLLVGLITISPAAFANWQWCCSDRQHAGATAQERCDINKSIVANRDQCEAQKKKHDASSGHSSSCTPK